MQIWSQPSVEGENRNYDCNIVEHKLFVKVTQDVGIKYQTTLLGDISSERMLPPSWACFSLHRMKIVTVLPLLLHCGCDGLFMDKIQHFIGRKFKLLKDSRSLLTQPIRHNTYTPKPTHSIPSPLPTPSSFPAWPAHHTPTNPPRSTTATTTTTPGASHSPSQTGTTWL